MPVGPSTLTLSSRLFRKYGVENRLRLIARFWAE